jgi:DivIVA domain-containing protein
MSLALDAMASMDVSPQELRDIEIREAWRGYHRDDVDELLERAAATIEHLEAENQQLRARVSQGGGPARAAAPAPTPAVVVAAPPPPMPAPAPVAAAAPVRMADTDVIQRTLVLAQKAADEAVAEARLQAQRIVGDAEVHSRDLVSRAEARAAEIAESERRKLEEDVGRLQNARDTLNADVDALERFEQEYRDRLHRAMQAELDLLGQTSSAGLERPRLHDVELPPATTTTWAEPSAAPAADSSWSASQAGVIAAPPVAPPAPTAPPSAGAATVHIEAVPAGGAAWDPAPAGGWADAPTAAVVDDSSEMALIDDHEAHGESLDDDAFFASLREAVRDDASLTDGGVAGAGDDDSAFFDQDDTDEHRGLFKRRR